LGFFIFYAHADSSYSIQHFASQSQTYATPSVAETSDLKALLNKIGILKTHLTQFEIFIRTKQDVSRQDLLNARDSLEDISKQLSDILKAVTPRIDSLKEQISQFSPKPAQGEPPESPAITQERTKKLSLLKDFEQVDQLSRAHLVQSQQLLSEIDTRRRNLFSEEFFSQNESILRPGLWVTALQSLPKSTSAIQILFKEWGSELLNKLKETPILTLLFQMFCLCVLLAFKPFFYRKIILLPWKSIEIPSKIACVESVFRRLFITLLPIVLGGLFIYSIFKDFGLIPSSMDRILFTLFFCVILLGSVYSLSEGFFAPQRPKWRLIPMSDSVAYSLEKFSIRSTFLIVICLVLEAILQAVKADLSLILLTKGIFSVLLGTYIFKTLYRLSPTPILGSHESEERRIFLENPLAFPLRMFGWISGLVFIIAPILGYAIFAVFLERQALIIAFCAAIFVIGRLIVEYGLSPMLTAQEQPGRFLLNAFRLQKNNLEVIRILVTSTLNFILIICMMIPFLTLWGIEWKNILSNLKGAITGIRIGELTISVSAILWALLTFIITITVVRALKRWLTTQLLPATSLDSALRNSITMVFGYVGMFLALTLALFQLGFGLDKIALLAGGLSVGIGFSLKPIVENFISGLILLWERFVRVGDWVRIGADEGLVKRITMRGTEIETFERAEIMIPNVNLISGSVQNWLRTDQMGRISIFVSVNYGSDPRQIADLLLECAREHHLVLTKPEPAAFFKKFGESAIEFELQCYISKIPSQVSVKSDLHFSIFSRFKENGIQFAWPRRELHIKTSDEDSLYSQQT
jgi:small-conductance mechanosensitive channel